MIPRVKMRRAVPLRIGPWDILLEALQRPYHTKKPQPLSPSLGAPGRLFVVRSTANLVRVPRQ